MTALGVTGPVTGMNAAQAATLRHYLNVLRVDYDEFHHGDAIGVDGQAATIASSLAYRTWAHPGNDPKQRAYHPSDIVDEPRPMMERNDVTVAAIRLLIAVVDGPELLRSGTWATVRRARKADVQIRYIRPSGALAINPPVRGLR